MKRPKSFQENEADLVAIINQFRKIMDDPASGLSLKDRLLLETQIAELEKLRLDLGLQ